MQLYCFVVMPTSECLSWKVSRLQVPSICTVATTSLHFIWNQATGGTLRIQLICFNTVLLDTLQYHFSTVYHTHTIISTVCGTLLWTVHWYLFQGNLLAPTGALVMMMVYYISIQRPLFQIFTQSPDAMDVTSVTLSRLNNLQMLKCSNTPMFKCSNNRIFKWSNDQMFKCSNALMFECSNVQMLKC